MESYGNDFLGLLLTAMHDVDENKKITFDNVIAECKTFYSAGFETLSSLLAWTVFLLAIHTDWQQEARKEVLDTLGDRDPDFNGTTKLKKVREGDCKRVFLETELIHVYFRKLSDNACNETTFAYVPKLFYRKEQHKLLYLLVFSKNLQLFFSS